MGPMRRWRRRNDRWPSRLFRQSRFSTWAHYSRASPWLVQGNERQWMTEKRLNWWSGNIFNAHCSEKSVKFGRRLYPPLLHMCSCAAGGFIQSRVRCLLTIATRRRWRKAAKMEEMAERDVHSSSHNALSARGPSGNRAVITFFFFFLHKLLSSSANQFHRLFIVWARSSIKTFCVFFFEIFYYLYSNNAPPVVGGKRR